MFLATFKGGHDRNFSYLIADGKEAAVIDPFSDISIYIKTAQQKGVKIRYILNTHLHFDHVEGNFELHGATHAQLLDETKLKDNQELPLGSLKIRCIKTPGHSKHDVCFLFDKYVFTGDCLFVGKIGGTASKAESVVQFASLRRLMQLPDDTEVLPGHDFGAEQTSTIGKEKIANPFLLCKDFESFQNLKENWLEYKKKHGIK